MFGVWSGVCRWVGVGWRLGGCEVGDVAFFLFLFFYLHKCRGVYVFAKKSWTTGQFQCLLKKSRPISFFKSWTLDGKLDKNDSGVGSEVGFTLKRASQEVSGYQLIS